MCVECMIAETDQPVMSEVKIKVDMAEDPEGHPECDAPPSSLVSSLKHDKILIIEEFVQIPYHKYNTLLV